MHSACIFGTSQNLTTETVSPFNFDLKKKLILKFFDDQVTSILPEATMIHEGSEICVKFVAKICWKTEKFTRKDGGYNPIEKYFVKLDLFPQGSG